MTPYAEGFLSKCASLGVSSDDALSLLKAADESIWDVAKDVGGHLSKSVGGFVRGRYDAARKAMNAKRQAAFDAGRARRGAEDGIPSSVDKGGWTAPNPEFYVSEDTLRDRFPDWDPKNGFTEDAFRKSFPERYSRATGAGTGPTLRQRVALRLNRIGPVISVTGPLGR